MSLHLVACGSNPDISDNNLANEFSDINFDDELSNTNFDGEFKKGTATNDQWGEDLFFSEGPPPLNPTPQAEKHSFKHERRPASVDVHISTPEYIEYKIKKNDTLMLISQSVYGDYSRWKEIIKINPMRSRHLVVGQILRLKKPLHGHRHFDSKGLPYIIHRGDTLTSISVEKYRTAKRWVDIYENNRNTIKNPDLIYAGFTLFYEPDPRLSSAF